MLANRAAGVLAIEAGVELNAGRLDEGLLEARSRLVAVVRGGAGASPEVAVRLVRMGARERPV